MAGDQEKNVTFSQIAQEVKRMVGQLVQSGRTLLFLNVRNWRFLDNVPAVIIIFSMTTTTVTGKNQITIPAKLARPLGIQPGTRIVWSIRDDGVLIARPFFTT
ncbi:MAG: AbrB/MazE/SpoVT family DNA-binding domain-containing protein [Anaerolineales bacterium]|nr:AbrB/MazE/SpoVT family DNA-binding domain-containing protein [Anaerolineales bacterium]